MERIYVLTNASQVDAIRGGTPLLPPENIIAEPAKRDTAPACALATGLARARDPKAICALVPADSMIHNVPVLRDQLRDAARAAAAHDALITFFHHAQPPRHGLRLPAPRRGAGTVHSQGQALRREARRRDGAKVRRQRRLRVERRHVCLALRGLPRRVRPERPRALRLHPQFPPPTWTRTSPGATPRCPRSPSTTPSWKKPARCWP